MERLLDLAKEKNGITIEEDKIDVYIISLGDVNTYSSKITELLRNNGIKTEMDYQKRSLKAQFKSADRYKAKAIIIVGENEYQDNVVQIKDTTNKTQENVEYEKIVEKIKNII